ncbi:GspE/PulE family protein [bacterium]|nr:GspE/PulE family protein [bacterium]
MNTDSNTSLEDLSKETSIEVAKELTNYPYIEEKHTPLPYSFASKHGILPLEKKEDVTLLAITDPFNLNALKKATFYLGKVKEVLTTKSQIQSCIEEIYGSDSQLFSTTEEEILSSAKEYDLLEQEQTSSVVGQLNTILLDAIRKEASDIHFEPVENALLIKYRIDGVLLEALSLPKVLTGQVITRLKVQAELDIAESRLPQDGRIKLKMGKRDIDFRVSTIPVIFGERVVLRISDNAGVLLGLENLGLKQTLLSKLQRDIRKKQGIILVTGPTGSGKTRTLYSALNDIASGDINIMTIEDPVENKLQGMAQIGVNPKRGLTFAKGLRHILRQDPDVIMIGEIRDKETVDIAIEASLTGHLVLSTLHTNDAPSTIIRLIDMGVEPYLISSSLISICSQRLIRKICTSCNNDPVRRETCKKCGTSGYLGRRGIYEYLQISDRLKAAISAGADTLTLKKIAAEEGMKTLYEDGLSYVKDGTTTIEELGRVTTLAEEE